MPTQTLSSPVAGPRLADAAPSLPPPSGGVRRDVVLWLGCAALGYGVAALLAHRAPRPWGRRGALASLLGVVVAFFLPSVSAVPSSAGQRPGAESSGVSKQPGSGDFHKRGVVHRV